MYCKDLVHVVMKGEEPPVLQAGQHARDLGSLMVAFPSESAA